ncbi:MAG: hypothetical protein LUC18_02435 [Porphyromonadaceae bacterium]|nr:hypothetical protein [Porphyromonadaceae bacterium]
MSKDTSPSGHCLTTPPNLPLYGRLGRPTASEVPLFCLYSSLTSIILSAPLACRLAQTLSFPAALGAIGTGHRCGRPLPLRRAALAVGGCRAGAAIPLRCIWPAFRTPAHRLCFTVRFPSRCRQGCQSFIRITCHDR